VITQQPSLPTCCRPAGQTIGGCSGVMNADLKEYAEAQLIKELNYGEVIEMA